MSASQVYVPMVAQEDEERKAFHNKLKADHLIIRDDMADEVAKAIRFIVRYDFVTGTTIDGDDGWLAAL